MTTFVLLIEVYLPWKFQNSRTKHLSKNRSHAWTYFLRDRIYIQIKFRSEFYFCWNNVNQLDFFYPVKHRSVWISNNIFIYKENNYDNTINKSIHSFWDLFFSSLWLLLNTHKNIWNKVVFILVSSMYLKYAHVYLHEKR